VGGVGERVRCGGAYVRGRCDSGVEVRRWCGGTGSVVGWMYVCGVEVRWAV
jgi:hypothetical protein